jgi:hypothetical protein
MGNVPDGEIKWRDGGQVQPEVFEVYEEKTFGRTPIVNEVQYELKGHEESPSGHKRGFSMDAPDIVAFGAVILCIGAVLVAVTIALGFVFGKVQGNQATTIILGCVGGAAIGGVVAHGATKKPTAIARTKS